MTQSTKQFKLDKHIWTEAEFDSMNWHDNPIHAMTFSDNFELLLDIDYIFEWVLKGKNTSFGFRPALWYLKMFTT